MTVKISSSNFAKYFKFLTSYEPMAWQSRLFFEYFNISKLPSAVQVPTGLGKTAVIALWLIARAAGANLPRRLVYVVDRRAVVDQATEFAETIRKNLQCAECADLRTALGLESKLPISTLRGQFVDNREWLEDPSGTSVIVGTVDMVGSRLLFEGYGIGRKMRPYHAGLLGADALVLLDEAHLVPPFEALLASIYGQAADFGPRDPGNQLIIPRFHMLPLSATGRTDPAQAFALEQQDFDDRDRDAEVLKRLKAVKRLIPMPEIGASVSPDDPETSDASESKTSETVKDKRPNDAAIADPLAKRAWEISNEGKDNVRVLVYCNSRDVAQKIEGNLTALAKAEKKDIEVELFVGARRVKERIVAAETLKRMGFLAGATVPRTQAVFLIATSAGEVGVDLDADHMVCDLVAWERMVQRFGRVNRRGEKDATIHVMGIAPKQLKLKALESPIEPIAVEKPKSGKNASTENNAFLERAYKDYLQKKKEYEAAVTKYLETEAENKKLSLDYRLAVAPKAALQALGPNASPLAILELNQRAASDPVLKQLLIDASTPTPLRPALTRALVDAWSMTSLAEHTGRPKVDPWLRGWIDDEPQTTLLWRKYLPIRVTLEPKKKELDAFFNAAPPHASELLETETRRVVSWLIERAADVRKLAPKITVIGMLLAQDASVERALRLNEIPEKQADGAEAKKVNDKKKGALEKALANSTLVVDAFIGGLKAGLLDKGESATAQCADDGSNWIPENDTKVPVIQFRIRTEDTSQAAFTDQRSGWRESLRFALEQNSDGEATRLLIVEKWGTASRPAVGPNQYLDEHQSWAERHALAIAIRLNLPEDFSEMLCVSAFLHDEGKQVERWQQAFRAPRNDKPYAKTLGPINQQLLAGYRHEFGSLPYAKDNARFKAMTPELQDLALHLIVAHHGYGRPVIATGGGTDAPSVLQERAREVALRFARLQKRWGPWGLAWWESLLRAADQKASRENEESTRNQGNK